MTTVYYAPDEAHRLEPLASQFEKLDINIESCVGLEGETGGDFLLSALPIDPMSNMQWHLGNRSIVVNLKVGYDALNNSDQRHKFAARVQRLGFKVAFLLGVGSYRNKDGFLQVSGYRTNDKVSYAAFQQMKLNEVARGVTWDSIETLEDLPTWIKAAAKMMELPGKNVVFSKAQYPLHEWYDDAVSDPWQSMEEVDRQSVIHTLACGLWNLGPKRAQSLVNYLIKHNLPVNLFQALYVLSRIDAKNKFIHKVPLIGTDYQKWIRDLMFRDETLVSDGDYKLLEGFNICLETTDNENEFHRGAMSGRNTVSNFFKAEIDANKPGKVAWNTALKLSGKYIDEFYRARQLPDEELPF